MKKNVLIFIIILIGNTVWGQNSLKNVINNGNLTVLDSTIERNELFDLSQSELRILRNTIYAKYGYIFKSVDLQNHFAEFSWYQAKNTNVDNYFSSIDKENIIRIQQREDILQEIIIFQNKILLWIQNEKISTPLNTVNINGISLYQNPILYQRNPDLLYFTDGEIVAPLASCFAMGRFLTPIESDRIMRTENTENLKNAIIFNPSVLFLNDFIFSRLYKPFNDFGTFLIVFPHDGSREYNIQAHQILNNSSKNIFILPWSVIYFVYIITSDGKLELVDRVAAN